MTTLDPVFTAKQFHLRILFYIFKDYFHAYPNDVSLIYHYVIMAIYSVNWNVYVLRILSCYACSLVSPRL
jgi:hypothetical protein